MLKLSFEGSTLSEVKQSIENFLSEIGAGGTVIDAASGGTKKETVKKETVKKKTSLEDVQDTLVKFQDAADDKKAAKAKLKGLFADFGVDSSSKLEVDEYDDFLAKLATL